MTKPPIAPVFARPAEDVAEARAKRDAPDLKRAVQTLEDALSRCAGNPDLSLDDRTLYKVVRELQHYLTGEYGTDALRAAIRHALDTRLFGDVAAAHVVSADGTEIVLDAYPEPGVAHVRLVRPTPTAKRRWEAVAPKPAPTMPRPTPQAAPPRRVPRRGRLTDGSAWNPEYDRPAFAITGGSGG